jgi:predicted methyltransferase
MKTFNSWVVATLLCGLCATALAVIPSYVTAALSDPARGKDAEADARRHPAELVAFAQVKPGETIVDLIPGRGYFTRIFSRIVGPSGHVYAVLPSEYAKENPYQRPLLEALVKDPHYSNVTLLIQPAARLNIPLKADVLWTSQNYHDYPDKFMGPTDPKILNDAVFNVLKPGGIFVVVDHTADTGSGMRDTDTLHRIDPQAVKEQVISSGFKFEAESEVLRNPADDHKLQVFEPAIRGHTDQFAFRFRKPN